MFKKRFAAGLLAAGMLLAGCSGSGGSGGSDGAKAVMTTCTAEQEGQTIQVVLNAPSENAQISSMDIAITMDLSSAGVDGEQLIDLYGSMIKSQVAQELGIDEEDLNVTADGSKLSVTVSLKDPKKFFSSVLGEEEVKDSDLVFSTAKAQLEAQFTCE